MRWRPRRRRAPGERRARSLPRRLWTLVWRTALFFVLLPIPVALWVRVATPPTTSFIVLRTVERWRAGERPLLPKHRNVPDDSIAPSLARAVTAAEDDRFYLHYGFDFEAIEDAIEERQRGGRLRGASTITQQLAKNLLLWEGRSWLRKGYEAYLTVWLELLVPKDRLLATYLNVVEWGDGVFGAEAAAQHWFGVSARRLTREQSARLAAILPSPRRWTPTGSVANRRVPTLLARMQYAAPRRADVAAETK